MELYERLAVRLHGRDVRALCALVGGDSLLREALYEAFFVSDNCVGRNALWVFTHMPAEEIRWLGRRRDALIDRVLTESDTARRRLLLTLLERMSCRAEEVRGDFVDFCLRGICRPDETAGVRALCIKLAYAYCRHYPDLCGELAAALEMLDDLPLSPAVTCARRRVLRQMAAVTGREVSGMGRRR